jgi:putative ABC transport system permease protein
MGNQNPGRTALMTPLSLADLRDAARGLRRAPTVTLSGILCLALGLGVTTAVSSAIDRALLQTLPYRNPGTLVTVYRTAPQANNWPFSVANYLDLARESHQLAEFAALGSGGDLLELPAEAIQVNTQRVTGNLFPMLGTRALHGRLITPDDDNVDKNPVAVVSEELWRSRFSSDTTLVGRTVRVGGAAMTVIGILPPDFRVLQGQNVLRADVWMPIRFTPQQRASRGSNYLRTLGRLAPGATAASAQTEMMGILNKIAETFPHLRGEGLRVVPLQSESAQPVRTPLLLLFGAVCIVLLIAATNVASLLLARGVHRRREFAVRSALGGSQWAVMRPMLAESLLLSMVGLLLGLGLAWVGVRTIGALAVRRLPQLAGLSIDLRVVAFAVIVSLIVAVACGVVPAWRSASVDPQEALRSGGRGAGTGRGHHRALGALVITEVGLSLVLLIGAGLVLKGFAVLLRNDPGFDPQEMLTLQVIVSPDHYPNRTAVERFLEPMLAAVSRVPGVENAGAIEELPYSSWGSNFNVRYEGQPADNPTLNPLVEYRVVAPEFFAVTRQRLISGRFLRAADDERPQAPTAVVVNAALARRDFPNSDPVGKRFYWGMDDTSFATIVGVVSDIRNYGPISAPQPEAYWSYRQNGRGDTFFPIVVRVKRGDPMAVVPAVRAAIRAVDPGVAIARVMPMTEVISNSVGQPRFYLSLLGVFAIVAMLLAVAGLYGVMSYAVAQRTQEMGIRSALGSPRARIVRLIAGHGAQLITLGSVVGLAGGAAVSRLLRGMLYGVSPLDASTWALATVALFCAGLGATFVPAYRATRVDPLIAMRAE